MGLMKFKDTETRTSLKQQMNINAIMAIRTPIKLEKLRKQKKHYGLYTELRISETAHQTIGKFKRQAVDDLPNQPSVDLHYCAVPPGFYCSEESQSFGKRRNPKSICGKF